MLSKGLSFTSLIAAVFCGAIVSLATGLIENPPRASVIGYRYYGHPLVWRVTRTFELPTEYMFARLALDAAFWIGFSYLVSVFLRGIVLPRLKVDAQGGTLLLALALALPLGLVMDFIHEFGHAAWGIALGGRLTHMQIVFFEIYPEVAIAQQFSLGRTQVTGLTSGFAYGIFLLGGSVTTNIVAWLLGLILVTERFGHRTRLAVKVLELFGLLDLPFYVIFPQIGLLHWIFVGGDKPEPLLGARQIGLPDWAFYVTTFLLTLGPVLLYSESIRKKVWGYMETFRGHVHPVRCIHLTLVVRYWEIPFNPETSNIVSGPVV